MDKLVFNKEAHKYFLNDIPIPGYSEIIETCGLCDLSNVRADILEASRKFGSALHRTIELWNKDDLAIDILDPNLKPYLNGWIKFCADYKFKATESERQVYSKLYWYAGTLDNVGLIHNAKTLVDVKSGLILPSVRLQTAAYRNAYNEMNPKGKIKRRLCVKLVPDGYKVEEYKDENDFANFAACVRVYSFKKQYNLIKGV